MPRSNSGEVTASRSIVVHVDGRGDVMVVPGARYAAGDPVVAATPQAGWKPAPEKDGTKVCIVPHADAAGDHRSGDVAAADSPEVKRHPDLFVDGPVDEKHRVGLLAAAHHNSKRAQRARDRDAEIGRERRAAEAAKIEAAAAELDRQADETRAKAEAIRAIA